MLRLCKLLGKINFLYEQNKKTNILEPELKLKIKGIKRQAAKIICFL